MIDRDIALALTTGALLVGIAIGFVTGITLI